MAESTSVPVPDYQVAIYHDEREALGRRCRISPAGLMAQPGNIIRFLNQTGEQVLIKFGGPTPFGENEFPVQNGTAVDKTVSASATSGPYPYLAICGKGVLAEGSIPIIIIYRDEDVTNT